MKLPKLKHIPQTRSTVKAFGGYNHTTSCKETEFYHSENLSARNYPALSPRLPRTYIATLAEPNGVYAKNGLLWVDGTALYFNGTCVGTVQNNKKQFCGFGASVLIWPDQLAFDTVTQTLSPLGAVWESTGNVTFAPCFEDGETYVIETTGAAAPESPENGAYWLDTSGANGDVLRVYSAQTESWGAVPTTYLKIAAQGIGTAFARYDSACLSGVLADTVGDTCATALNATLVLWDVADDYVVVTGLLAQSGVQTHAQGVISLTRKIPDLDYITQSDNRVWGCSSAEHTIYASKLGDATNWYSYMGTAADSYAVSVGSDGDFTGAAVSLGYVLLFKEHLIHKVYGTKPANYQITTIACRGVKKGCARSIATVNETLFYQAVDDVMQYDGGLPGAVGAALGKRTVACAVAGAVDSCYYLCVREGDAYQLFCYDTARGVWHREDNTAVVSFTRAGAALYLLKTDGTIWAIGSATSDTFACADVPENADGNENENTHVSETIAENETAPQGETAVSWYGETGDIGLYQPDHKTVSKIEVRVQAEQGAQMTVEAQYDASGTWETLASFTAQRKQMFLLPMIPHRFDHMKLRYRGTGDVTLFAVTKSLEEGSELAWQT